MSEVEVERFNHAGLKCKIVKQEMGHWCGYVRAPEDVEHVRWTSDYDSKHDEIIEAEVDVWGGITYGPDENGWVGFDDNHGRALVDQREQNSEKSAVKEETQRLAEQIVWLDTQKNQTRMRLKDYESEKEAKRGCAELVYSCENGHKVTVYSSDLYYPDWVECPHCGKLMECIDETQRLQ